MGEGRALVAHLTINVPKDLVDDLRAELQRALLSRATALRHALDAYLDSSGPLDDLDGALVELRDLDHALVQLPPVTVASTITAHPETLTDALRALVPRRPDDILLFELLRTVEGGR